MKSSSLVFGFLVALLLALGLFQLRGETGAREVGAGIAPGLTELPAEHGGISQALPTADPLQSNVQASHLAEDGAVGREATRSDALDTLKLGSISGRVLLAGQPAEGVSVSLRWTGPAPTPLTSEQREELQATLEDDSLDDETMVRMLERLGQGQGLIITSYSDATSQSDLPAELNAPLQQRTQKDGEYNFEELEPGVYTITYAFPFKDNFERSRVNGKSEVEKTLTMMNPMDVRLTDVSLPNEAEYLRVRTTPAINASIRVRSDREGLSVYILSESSRGRELIGQTGPDGELSFPWHEQELVSLSISDHYRVLNSTNANVILAPDGETVVDLPSVWGSLRILLPEGTQAVEHEAAQYSLWKSSETEDRATVETVQGGAAPRETAQVKSAPNSLEFLSLSPGNYQVAVRFMVLQQDGRWLPSGTPLRGSVELKGEAMTECYVN